jgi:ribosomal protein S18 acetylase RimI-like enzyme
LGRGLDARVTFSVRRLGPGDEALLALLARDEADFGLESENAAPLSLENAAAYLADPHVLHWICSIGDAIAGHTYCHLLRKRAGDPMELLLYDIGVRKEFRRRGVGAALMQAIAEFMREHKIREAWVLASDAAASAFYRSCGYASAPDQPDYMTLS